ncbi:hypothetical protein EYF80_019059 [Liparis tanakae]|uniref:Uncharacterized protein n=1 Tax=Liparis tanakae TaxID=230148 RepID=A0A4Z2HY32_9TELE|nr:hypothetical protein EYF80_019059 [Liparis tanakae]
MGFIWMRVMQREHHSFSASLTGKKDLKSRSTTRLDTGWESIARRASSKNKPYAYSTLAARTALTFMSMSRNAMRTFSETLKTEHRTSGELVSDASSITSFFRKSVTIVGGRSSQHLERILQTPRMALQRTLLLNGLIGILVALLRVVDRERLVQTQKHIVETPDSLDLNTLTTERKHRRLQQEQNKTTGNENRAMA